MEASYQRWAVLWHSRNRLNGDRRHFAHVHGVTEQPALFMTRREAREFIKRQYGYIAGRKDLREEPHGWRVPKAVRVTVTVVTREEQR